MPAFVEKPNNLPSEDEVKRSAEKAKQENKGKATVSVGTGPDPEPSDTKVAKAKKPDDSKPKPEDIVETETIRGKNGAVVTRTVLKDGSVNLKRRSNSMTSMTWPPPFVKRRARRRKSGLIPIRPSSGFQMALLPSSTKIATQPNSS